MDYILTARSLGKRYRNFKALDDFSIHVPKGAIYGFVGKNGAGKTNIYPSDLRSAGAYRRELYDLRDREH